MKKLILFLLIFMISSPVFATPNSYKIKFIRNVYVGNSLNASTQTLLYRSADDDIDFLKIRAEGFSNSGAANTLPYGCDLKISFLSDVPNTYTAYSYWTIKPGENEMIPITSLNYPEAYITMGFYGMLSFTTLNNTDSSKVNAEIIGIKTLR